jgi:signal transduction histidine kinase
VEFRVSPGGVVRWLRDQGELVGGVDGRARVLTGACVDITDTKEAAEALRVADRRKNEFLAVLAHELRNPLAPIATGLQVLKLAPRDSVQAQRQLRTMEAQLAHIVRLIDDLLDVSRISRGVIGLQKEDIPEIRSDDGKVIVNAVSGSWNGQAAPIESLIDIHIATIFMAAGGRLQLPVAHSRNIFLYVVRGDVMVGGESAGALHLVEMHNDGDTVDIEAITDAVLLFGHAEPIGEPVVAHGPFVMNTREEIRQAMIDYQAGKF